MPQNDTIPAHASALLQIDSDEEVARKLQERFDSEESASVNRQIEDEKIAARLRAASGAEAAVLVAVALDAAVAKRRFLPAAAARARDEVTLATHAIIAEAARQLAPAMRNSKKGRGGSGKRRFGLGFRTGRCWDTRPIQSPAPRGDPGTRPILDGAGVRGALGARPLARKWFTRSLPRAIRYQQQHIP